MKATNPLVQRVRKEISSDFVSIRRAPVVVRSPVYYLLALDRIGKATAVLLPVLRLKTTLKPPEEVSKH
jgi:hypothetical protein